MIEIKRFVCEYCHTEYVLRKDCEQCESLHKKPVKIIQYDYEQPKNQNTDYPSSITVKMENGEQVIYRK